jgi:FAD/FMN-containing dehydrogenase
MIHLIESTVRQLHSRLPGRISRPGQARYIAATAIWAKPIGAMPLAVVHCRSVDDVQIAIEIARVSGLPLSARGGGHDWAGRALCEGLMIDLSYMRDVIVSPDRHTADLSGDARACDVTVVTDAFGVAAVTGSCSGVGMVGLTLGGGYGPLIGRCGLALDNLVSADVVLADGRAVVANHEREKDLFWALRGGGGNFGVVTAMRIKVHDVPYVISGVLAYPFSQAKSVLHRYADALPSFPADLSVKIGAIAGAAGKPVLLLVPTWCGSAKGKGEAEIARLIEFGTPIHNSVKAARYGTSLSVFDPHIVYGQRALMETCWLPELNDASIEALVDVIVNSASAGCAIFTHEFRGAATEVPTQATAFGLRRNHVLIEILASFPDRTDKSEEQLHQHWVKYARQTFDVEALPGGYPNLLAAGETGQAMKSYGLNAERLIEVKRQYDPDNFFRSAIPLPLGHKTSENAVVDVGAEPGDDGAKAGRKVWTAPTVVDLGPRSDAQVDTKASAGAATR